MQATVNEDGSMNLLLPDGTEYHNVIAYSVEPMANMQCLTITIPIVAISNENQSDTL